MGAAPREGTCPERLEGRENKGFNLTRVKTRQHLLTCCAVPYLIFSTAPAAAQTETASPSAPEQQQSSPRSGTNADEAKAAKKPEKLRTFKKGKVNAADRFDNPAADIVIEDMAPFFGFSTFNGREITGSNNYRDISFRQFPTELMKENVSRGVQSADQVEGALFGLTTTDAIKPLDLKRRRIQAELRGIYAPYADRSGQDPGKRVSASYIDQFDTSIGRIGISAGFMLSDSFLPKDFYKATTAVRPCNSIGLVGNCTFSPTSSNPTYFATGSHTFRQQRSDEKQRAYFGTIQWQPSDRLDISFDAERSSRVQSRYRSEFSLTEGFRNITPLEIAPSGAPLRYSGESALESLAFARTRDEKYTGFGLTIRYEPTDRLTISTDASYSRTTRLQTDISASMASNDLFGPGGRVPYTIDLTHGGVPVIDFATPINLNNYDAYTEDAAARRGRDTRRDVIKAWRGDVAYKLDGLFDEIKAGVRYSTHTRTGQLLTYLSNNDIPVVNVVAGNANCRRGPITTDFLADSGTNINSWAVFDPACLYATFTGSTDFDKPLTNRTGGGIEIHEKIWAGYVMGTFKTDLAAIPVHGNVGLRLVETRRWTSVYRFTGNPTPITDHSGSIVDLLPSAELTASPRDNLQISAAAYRTLLRSAVDGFNMRRVIAGPAGVMERQRPLRAWNLDASVHYRPDKDTALSLDLYYKFFSSSPWPGDLIIPGGPVLNPALRADSLKKSYLRGFAVAVNRSFSTLPAPFDGLSVQGSYAFSDTNFRFQDPSATDPANPLYLFVDPASIPGLSKHVATAAVRYDKDGWGLGATYEYRSGYFRPTGLTSNRVLGATNYLNAFISHQLTNHVQMRLSAANLTNEHEVLYRPVSEAVGQTSYAGTTYQLSLRLRY
ncbi:hypothetical protein CA262_20360 [Sphingobium sp. GW456-12-10-14-TSB1]|jgi:TonB-dependent receptor|nr:hypothetical protein CA262_20360 [Sphingobium sp. GW456-12-10-14-TSB1]